LWVNGIGAAANGAGGNGVSNGAGGYGSGSNGTGGSGAGGTGAGGATGDGLCLLEHFPCFETDASCCPGLGCGYFTFQGLVGTDACCVVSGGPCQSWDDCCSQVCTDGQCACGKPNQHCSVESDCCAGEGCPAQGSGAQSCCGLANKACTSPQDCCSGGCNQGQCDCSGPEQGCATAADCCNALACTAGQCCNAPGQSCESDGDCCSGGTCVAGLCCAGDYGSCASTADCCNAVACNAARCCAPSRSSCSSYDDCCSGFCSDAGQCCVPSFQDRFDRFPGFPECSGDPDCCAGHCDGDICCSAADQACQVDSDCCSGSCAKGACARSLPNYLSVEVAPYNYCGGSSDCPPGYACVFQGCLGEPGSVGCDPDGGNYCSPKEGCLSGAFEGDSGICACSAAAIACSRDQDCCDAGHCVLGYCGP
jgi:hypothetical protein